MALTWLRPDSQDDERWRQAAACRNTNAELFFPVGSAGPAIDHIEAAKAVCRACPSLTPCLEYALETNQDAGVWGGASEDERRLTRRRRRRAAQSA